MKNVFALVALAYALLFCSSCANDIDVIGNWEDIPVVYGILRPQDSASYIKIEKAYLDPRTSAFEVAQRPDSLYYPEAELEVVLWSRLDGRFPFRPDTLRRVDLALRGLPRDSGIFASRPNYAYEVPQVLMRFGHDYRLEIKNLRTGKLVESQIRTPFVGGVRGTGFSDFFISASQILTPQRPTNWLGILPTGEVIFNDVAVQWVAPDGYNIFDVSVRIKYAEFEVDVNQVGEPELGGTRVEKELLWRPVQNFVVIGANYRVNLRGESFINFLQRSLASVEGTNKRRCLGRFDVLLRAGGPHLQAYIETRTANEGLLAGLNPIEPYSNLSEALGLFCATADISLEGLFAGEDTYTYLTQTLSLSSLGFRSQPCL